jgi:hypothetical protein
VREVKPSVKDLKEEKPKSKEDQRKNQQPTKESSGKNIQV